MSAESKIEWTDATWNPTRGCRKVSPGCKHCYAETFAERFEGVKGHPYELGFAPRLAPDKLDAPLHWKKPRRIFVNSMSDLFLEDFPDEYIAACFAVMAATPRHTYQVLTKRAERMRRWFERVSVDDVHNAAARYFDDKFGCAVANYINGFSRWRDQPDDGNPLNGTVGRWPLPNVWLGVSVETQVRADQRIPCLLATPAAVRFLSVEPLLGPMDLRRWTHRCSSCVCSSCPPGFDDDTRMGEDRLGWVIVGGESGPGARPMDLAWARSIVNQCKAAGVACFVKQLGAHVVCGDCGDTGIDDDHPESVCGKCWDFERLAKSGRIVVSSRKGGDPSEWPADLRVREFPEPRP